MSRAVQYVQPFFRSVKKTIPGLRDALLEAERKGALSDYVILKVKQDFDLEEVATTDELLNISGEDE